MRILSLQHVPFEGLGSMVDVFDRLGFSVTSCHLYAGDALPALDSFDWLVVMGGPMGVNDEGDYPWLAAEKQLIKEAITTGKRVLGVCLGAQLVAKVLGARVAPNSHREIGWFPIQPTSAAADTPWGEVFASKPLVFHWHGDTFSHPPEAIHLATSEACQHQAFAIGTQVLGLQFHLETTETSAEALLEHCADELDGSQWVQSAEDIRADPTRYVAINQLMERVIAVMLSDGFEGYTYPTKPHPSASGGRSN